VKPTKNYNESEQLLSGRLAQENRRRQHAVIISPEVPAPVGSGGQVRSYHFLRAVAETFDVTLVLLAKPSATRDLQNLQSDPRVRVIMAGEPLRIRRPARAGIAFDTLLTLLWPPRRQWVCFWDRFLHYREAFLRSGSQGRLQRGLLVLFRLQLRAFRWIRPRPVSTHYLQRGYDSVRTELVERVPRRPVDLLLLEHTFSFPLETDWAKALKPRMIVCNAHNIESELFRRQALMTEVLAQRDDLFLQSRLHHDWERRAFETCDLTLVCSHEDLRQAQKLAPKARLAVAANGVDTDYFAQRCSKFTDHGIPTVVFTGTMDYPPNRDAVIYFKSEIFPLIRQAIPGCVWIVAGRRAAMVFADVNLGEGVRLISDPEDIRSVYDESPVAVVPLRFGSGTRLKILEALSLGKAVVTTTVGAEGIGCRHGEHLIVADDPEIFAREVVRLLRNPVDAAALGIRGQAWVRKNHAWSSITGKALEQIKTHFT
jgi:glycosyltransferase involved in cell wall biosynthesis